MSTIIQSDKELLRKAFIKKTRKVVVTAVIIVILAFFVYVLLTPRGLSIEFSWNDNHPLYGSPFVHLRGTISNSGTKDATDAQLVVRLYDSHSTLMETEAVDVGDIPAKGSKKIDIDIPYVGFAEKCETELQWKTKV